MSIIIDRRLNPRDKTIKNRQKFIERARHQIKKVVKESIDKGNISDIEKGKVRVKVRNIDEPTFGIDGRSGNSTHVLPGNKKYIVGDSIEKPKGSGGRGSGNTAGDGGDGEDNFEFVLTASEYANFIFEDLELPDMIKKQMKDVTKLKPKRAGFKNQGNPAQLDYVRSLKNGMARRIGLKRPNDEEIKVLEALIAGGEALGIDVTELLADLESAKARQKRIPWLDPFDMRYRNFEMIPQPMTKAVMFCIMDVSGSMGQNEKDIAKRFFFLLHMFLTRKYEKVDIVFIRHHHEAREVDEDEFFYGKDSGGTVVSTAVDLTRKIIADRYNVDDWNIYCAQASDGDNMADDGGKLTKGMKELLSVTQYFAYVEIKPPNSYGMGSTAGTDLWKVYEPLQSENMKLKRVSGIGDIWTVFKELFSKGN